MKVRSVTYFAPLAYPFDERDIVAAGRFLKSAQEMLADVELETQTVRLATPPFCDVLGDPTAAQAVEMARSLEGSCAEQGIEFVSIGSALVDAPEASLAAIYRLPDVLTSTQHVFATALVASVQRGINLAAIQACAEVIHEVAHATHPRDLARCALRPWPIARLVPPSSPPPITMEARRVLPLPPRRRTWP